MICRSLAVATIAFVLLANAAFAQFPTQDGEVPFNAEGNWIAEYVDYPQKGEVSKSALTVARPWKMEYEALPQGGGRWFFARQEGPWQLRKTGGGGYLSWGGGRVSVNAGQVRVDHPTLMLGNWGGVSEVSASGPNAMRGNWTYQEEYGGAVAWRRAVSKLEKVVFTSGGVKTEARPGTPARVEVNYSGPGNDMRGNRPAFYVSIHGKNFWGHHVIDLGGAIDLEPRDFKTFEGEVKGLGPDSVAGKWFTVIVWPRAKPGRKTLWIDHQSIELDLVVNGYPHGEDDLKGEREQACEEAVEDARGVGDELEMPELWDGWDTLEATGEIIDEIAKDKPAEEMLKWSMDTLIEKMVREKNAEKLARMEAVYKRKLLRYLQSKGMFLNKTLPKISKEEIEALKAMYRYSPSIPQRMSSLVQTWKGIKRIQREGFGSFLRGRLGRAFTAKLFSRVFVPVSTAMDLYEIYKFVRETEELKDAWEGALRSMEQAEGCNYELYEFRKDLSPEERRRIEDLRWREADYFRRHGLPPPLYPPWPGEALPPRP